MDYKSISNISAEYIVANLNYLYSVGVRWAFTNEYTYNLEKLKRVLK